MLALRPSEDAEVSAIQCEHVLNLLSLGEMHQASIREVETLVLIHA